ncbi:hypothetical protein ACHAPX_002613 [Trichoderma viride]
MVTIFENAYLTIGATASSESNSLCYRSISQEAYERTFAYGGRYFRNPAATVYVREEIPHFSNRDFDEVKNREFPLLERAWVYQEQILSSRMLHFCNMELFFECKKDADCECEEVTAYWSTKKVLLNELLQKKNQNVVFSWPEFVEDYTELKMTYDRDRLPAFSSIARKVAQLNPGDCYLAGKWKSTLLKSLLWVIVRGKLQRYRPAEPRAPSWSWASAFGSISWRSAKGLQDTKGQVYATLVRAECNPVDGDSFGRVNSGIMTLSGKVTPCLLTWSISEDVNPQESGWKIAVFDNLPYDRSYEPFHFQLQADYPFNLDMPGHLDIFCLWLYQRSIGDWTGLVLRQINKTFERIGIFKMNLEEGHIPWDIVEAIDLTMDII